MSKVGEKSYEQSEETEEEKLKGKGPPRKNRGSSTGSEYSDDDGGVSEEGEDFDDEEDLDGEADVDEEADMDDEADLEEAEEDGLEGRNQESEKVEEDIFNENNLLHAIKTREVLEQEILVLFSNMLKKEVVLNKDLKSTSREEISTYKGEHVDDEHTLERNDKGGANKKKETEKKSNLKIKNKDLYNFIYSKMNLSAREGTDKKREDKGAEGTFAESGLSRKKRHAGGSRSRSSSRSSSGHSSGSSRSNHSRNRNHNRDRNHLEKSNQVKKMANIQQVEKEHYILDNNVVNILNDINTYLRREREYLNRKFGNHVDSTFKNPMYVTLYIYNNQILKDIILQMINIVKNEFDSSIYRDIDETMLTRNIFILINHLTSRPSKEWFDYWNKHMPTFNNKRSEFNVYNYLQIEKNERKVFSGVLKNDIYFKELQKRSNIIEQYQNGLQSLKCLLSSRNFLTLLNEFRYNCQLFIDADYRGIEENEKVLEMQRRDAELIEEKARLKEELQFCRERLRGGEAEDSGDGEAEDSGDGEAEDSGGDEAEDSGGDIDRGDGCDPPEGEEASRGEGAAKPRRTNKLVRNKITNLKRRIDEINEELLEVANFFLEDKKKRERLVHEYRENVYLVRSILTQVLGIRNPRRSNAINSSNVHYVILQNVLGSHSALTLIIEEMRHLFDRELKKYESEKNIHIPYLRQNTMKEIWDYVRLFYNVVCYIDPIDLVRSLTHQVSAGCASGGRSGDKSGDKSGGRSGDKRGDKNDDKRGDKRCDRIGGSVGGTARNRLSAKKAPAPSAAKRSSLLNPRKNNQMIMHLSRINPLLAKSKVRKPNEEKHMKKKKKKFIERKNLIDHYENFSFEDLSFDIFEEKKAGGGGSFLKGNILDTFNHSNLYRVQEFLNNIIGINEEFENVYEGNSHEGGGHEDDDGFNYSLKVFLNVCIKDLRRCIVEYYNHQWDIKIILNIHAWIVTYYTNFYLYENRKRLNNCRKGKGISNRYSSASHFYNGDEEPIKEGKHTEDQSTLFISRIQMVLGMQAYIGDNSIHSEFLCDTFQRLIREEKMKKNSSKIILCCLRCLHADLSLIDLHALSTDDNVKSICKSSLDNFLRRNILNSLSWILKNFKLMSHDRSIFTYALKCALMIIELLKKLGGSTYIMKGGNKIYDEDEEEEEEEVDELYNSDGSDNQHGDSKKYGRSGRNGGSGKRGQNASRDYDAEAIERVSVMDLIEEIYSGKIVNTCMHIIEEYKRNSIQINHLIITYFEFLLKFKNNDYNFLLFFDMKYFIIFMDIINDQECYTNPRYHWIASFFENLVACFFKLWNSNYFLPVELFFSKAINRNLFSLLSEKYMLSIFSNYSEGNDHFVFEELNKGMHINDIFMEMNSRKRLESLEWSAEDIESLKIYFKQFKHMHNFLPFISEMLNKSSSSVKNQLIFLNYMDRRGNVIDDDVDYDMSYSSDSSGGETDAGMGGGMGDEMDDEVDGGMDDEVDRGVDAETGKGVDTEADTEAESTTPRSPCRAATHERRKAKQPLLYTVYKLKKLNQVQEKETNLTSNGINCNVDSVLEEVSSNLKSLYELKKLSKNKFFSYKALLFDIPLSISSELLEHNSFKKLLSLIGFVYKENSDEWVLNEHLDVDIFRSIVEKCEELFPLSLEELRGRLRAPERDKVSQGGDLSHDAQGSDKDDVGKQHQPRGDTKDGTLHSTSDSVHGSVHGSVPSHSDEQLHLMEPPKLKGTFALLKLMYDLFISNEDDFRIFFNDLVNLIRDKFSSLFQSRKTEGDTNERKDLNTENDTSASTASQKNDPNLDKYTIFLEPKDRQVLRRCQKKQVLSELLQYLWVYLSKSEHLIISKHIKEKDFSERFRVINNYKTLGVSEIESIIRQKQFEIDEKKKQKKETKPTSQQKFFFIKRVCEYLHRVYVPANMGSMSTGRNCPLNETYFGGDKLLTCIYEKLNSWNSKRSKKNDDSQCFALAAMDLLSYIVTPSEVNPGVTATTGTTTGTTSATTADTTVAPLPQSVDPDSFLPLVENICVALKASEEEGGVLKWHPEQVQRQWLKIMLKLFYNVLYDSEYNTVGNLFLEYRNIKEILKDKSLDFLSPQGGAGVAAGVAPEVTAELAAGATDLYSGMEELQKEDPSQPFTDETYLVSTQYEAHTGEAPSKRTSRAGGATADQSKIDEAPSTPDAIPSEPHSREIPLKPIAPHKRKLGDIHAEDYSEFFKKRKLQNAYVNMYRKNRKSIIDSLLKNKNIAQYKESDIINRVKQVFIKARQMASTGDLRNRWKSRDDVKRILLL